MKKCGVILSGGKSSRMGTDKSLLRLNDRPIIEHIYDEMKKLTKHIAIITNKKSAYKYLQVPLYGDRYNDKGPLAGIESALYHVKANIFIFSACDTPFIQAPVYEQLLEHIDNYDAVVPTYQGRKHPLSGVYKQSIWRFVKRHLENNHLRVMSFFDDIHVKYIDSFPGISEDLLKLHFFNMNVPSQYEEAINTYRLFNQS